MQWTAGECAGFSTARPWLPLADDYAERNVAAAKGDPTSLLSLYRRLIDLRRAEPALSIGAWAALPAGEDLMAYIRKAGDRRLLIVLNFGARLGVLRLRTTGRQAPVGTPTAEQAQGRTTGTWKFSHS